VSALDSLVPVSGPRWYAISVRSRHEKRTEKDLAGKGVEVFLPLIEEIHVWSDRKKKVIEPLFRGYVFVRSDLRNRVDILQTVGVVNFVSNNGRPSPVPDQQIDWVKKVAMHPMSIRRESYIDVGERVRIARGPFAGLEGIIMRQKGNTRVLIAVEAILQAVSIEVEDNMLERPLAGPATMLVGRRETEALDRKSLATHPT
jgi:transcriptional antiterminator RfaH